MALTYLQMTYKIFITICCFALLYTVTVLGYSILKDFLTQSDRNDCFYQRMLKYFFGTILYLSAFLGSLILLGYDVTKETIDDEEEVSGDELLEDSDTAEDVHEEGETEEDDENEGDHEGEGGESSNPEHQLMEQADRTYSRLRRQRHVTTDHVRKVYQSILQEMGTQTRADMVVTLLTPSSQMEVADGYPLHVPELPSWVGLQSRESFTSTGLNYRSFNFDSTGIVLSCDRFLVEDCPMTFQDLKGIDDLKKIIMGNIITPIVASQTATVTPLDIPRGILLIGEEGSGKRSISQAIVNELRKNLPDHKVNFYRIDGANCFGSFIGSGATFRDIFHVALKNSSMAVLLFENIENLFDRSISIFLSELSSLPPGKLFVIATSSKKEKLHQRLVHEQHSKKFRYIIELQFPDFWKRAAILKDQFQKRQCAVNEQDVLEVANLAKSFTPGDLENLVLKVCELAKEGSVSENGDMTLQHFKDDTISNGIVIEENMNTEENISGYRPTNNEIKRQYLMQAFEKLSQNRVSRKSRISV